MLWPAAMILRKHDGCAFVLWADYYDDLLTALFVANLRRAGWHTRLIGLNGDTHSGCNGIKIVADISLSQALRSGERPVCIVAPCAPEQIETGLDGRLGEFLDRAGSQGAVFVAKPRLIGSYNHYWPDNGLTVTNNPAEVFSLLHLVIQQLEKVH